MNGSRGSRGHWLLKILAIVVGVLTFGVQSAQLRTSLSQNAFNQGIVSFTLINTDTNQAVPDFDPIQDGTVINLYQFPTRNLSIRANSNPQNVGSVRFVLNSSYSTVENVEPYALFGDNAGNYNPGLTIGRHVLTATPYENPWANGPEGTSLTLNFTVIDQPPSPTPTPTPTPTPAPTPTPTPTPIPGDSVTSLSLINADNDQVVAGFESLHDGAVLDLSSLPSRNLNIRANSNPSTVGSVRFEFNASPSIENVAPYALCGDFSGDYRPCGFTAGSYSLRATPFSGSDAVGSAGNSLTITFSVIDAAPTPTPTPSPTPSPAMVFPGADWQVASPEQLGVNSSRLEEAFSYLSQYLDVSSTAVIRNGYLIRISPGIDTRFSTFSVTKSFTSTVLGLIVDDGKASLDTLAKDSLPSMAAQYPQVNLRHFTTMTSGYDAVGESYEPPDGSSTPFSPTTPLFSPGSQYAYFDDAMNQFGHALTRIGQESIHSLFRRRVGDRIGMTNWDWPVLGYVDGYVIDDGSGNQGGINISARQLARLGHLFLNRGNWNGQQILSASWVDQATSNQVPVSIPHSGIRAHLDGRGVYGYNWWVNGIQADGSRIWPSAPLRTFSAWGLNQNRIWVIPEWNMVIVRLGSWGDIPNSVWDGFFARLSPGVSQ